MGSSLLSVENSSFLIKFGPVSFIFEEVVRTTLEAFSSVPLDHRYLNASSVRLVATTF